MTLQARKLNLIQDVLAITDARMLTRVEGCLKEERAKAYEKTLRPMSMEEFGDMIERSHADVLAGRVVGLEELRKDVARW
jgi:hypothetical protein